MPLCECASQICTRFTLIKDLFHISQQTKANRMKVQTSSLGYRLCFFSQIVAAPPNWWDIQTHLTRQSPALTAGGTAVTQMIHFAEQTRSLPKHQPTDAVRFTFTQEKHRLSLNWIKTLIPRKISEKLLLMHLFIHMYIWYVAISASCGMTVLLILICTLPILFLHPPLFLCMFWALFSVVSWVKHHHCAVKCFPRLDNTHSRGKTCFKEHMYIQTYLEAHTCTITLVPPWSSCYTPFALCPLYNSETFVW